MENKQKSRIPDWLLFVVQIVVPISMAIGMFIAIGKMNAQSQTVDKLVDYNIQNIKFIESQTNLNKKFIEDIDMQRREVIRLNKLHKLNPLEYDDIKTGVLP